MLRFQDYIDPNLEWDLERLFELLWLLLLLLRERRRLRDLKMTEHDLKFFFFFFYISFLLNKQNVPKRGSS